MIMKTLKRKSVSKTQDELVHEALKNYFGYAKPASMCNVYQTAKGDVCVSDEETEQSILKLNIDSSEGISTLYVDMI